MISEFALHNNNSMLDERGNKFNGITINFELLSQQMNHYEKSFLRFAIVGFVGKLMVLRNLYSLFIVFMSPIVIFVITFNCFLCLLCLWTAAQIVQWRRSVIRLNEGLVRSERSFQNGLIPIQNLSFAELQTHYQQLHQSLQFQLIPAFQLLTSLLTTIYAVQRRWSQIKRLNPVPRSDRQKPMSRHIR